MGRLTRIILAIFGFLGLISLCPKPALAQDPHRTQVELTPSEFFVRCYSAMTGFPPPTTHPLFAQIAQGLSAVDACMQILDKATLVPTAQTINLTPAQRALIVPANTSISYTPYTLRDVADAEGSQVLNSFHELHRSFLSVPGFVDQPAYSTDIERLNDPTEGALFYTRALFRPNARCDEIVTARFGLRGIRDQGPKVMNNQASVSLTVAGAGLDRGLLRGIGDYGVGNHHWQTDTGGIIENLQAQAYAGAGIDFNFWAYRNFGGGVLGLHSTFSVNSGSPGVQVFDDPTTDPAEARTSVPTGAIRMWRRLAFRLITQTLGRPFPAMRVDEDARPLATAYTVATPDVSRRLAFRASAGCMACHATIDGFASAYRLYHRYAWNAPWLGGTNPVERVTFVTIFQAQRNSPVLLPPEQPPLNEQTRLTRDPDFWKRIPGTIWLRFRGFAGNWVSERIVATDQLTALDQLGAAIAQQDDFYVNIAARYFHFFTGVQVNLQDELDPANPPLSAADSHYRDIVINLGLQLRAHQSLRTLVREILDSDLYKKRSMRDVQL